MFKKSMTLVFAFLMVFSLSATGAMAADIIFKVATVEADETPTSKAIRDFKKFVEEKTNGKVEVQYFNNGVLGGERESIEGVALGTIQLCLPASSVLSMYGDKFNLFELPFLYDSFDVAYKIWDGEIGDIYSKWIEEQGLVNLGYVAYTARGFGNSAKPVRVPADMKGLKVRVVESKLYIDLFKAFGANPTPIPVPEVYTALQQGTVNAVEQGPMETYSNKFHEQIKYYTWLKHIVMPVPIMANKSYMEKLPADVKAVILEGVKDMEVKLRDQLYKEEVKNLEDMRQAGVETIAELTPEEVAQFRALIGPIYDEYRKIVGDEMFDKMLSYNK
ncbi:TRAP transporter substrate-binding protein [Deltaproteobacteria bacterium OttesenSCG-928-M10]|nr:TRAP transporter substrate-binding protein [Deltaproteobacteria bacterium OttesenSCG-928-M10]